MTTLCPGKGGSTCKSQGLGQQKICLQRYVVGALSVGK